MNSIPGGWVGRSWDKLGGFAIFCQFKAVLGFKMPWWVLCYYRVSQNKIVFRNIAEFSLRGVWAVKIWVFWGAEHIYVITMYPMCLHLCEPQFLHFTHLNSHLIKGFAILLKTIFSGTLCILVASFSRYSN